MADRVPAVDEALATLRQQYLELLERLDANRSEFQGLARSVYRVQEDERRRIARELHDGIGQNLTALKHRLALLATRIDPGDLDTLESLASSVELCAQTLEDTRELSRLLRPQVLDDLGLEAALQWLARSIESSGGPRIELAIDALPALDTDMQTLLFRVTQEALSNISRHARASEVLLRLVSRAGRVMLTVWDNGVGFDPAVAARSASAGNSAGLSGMRERVRLHGGELQVESGSDTGTWLRATIPLPAPGRPPPPS